MGYQSRAHFGTFFFFIVDRVVCDEGFTDVINPWEKSMVIEIIEGSRGVCTLHGRSYAGRVGSSQPCMHSIAQVPTFWLAAAQAWPVLYATFEPIAPLGSCDTPNTPYKCRRRGRGRSRDVVYRWSRTSAPHWRDCDGSWWGMRELWRRI